MGRRTENYIVLLGNIGKDATINNYNGRDVARFTLATEDAWKDRDGNWQSKAQWHNVVAFGRQAEIVHKFAKKGAYVYVKGSMQYSDYVNQKGEKHTSANVKCDTFIVLSKIDDVAHREECISQEPDPGFGEDGLGAYENVDF